MQKWDYKIKNKALALAFGLGLVVIWNFAIRNTLNLRTTNNDLESRIWQTKNAPKELQNLQLRQQKVNERMGNFDGDSSDQTSKVLEVVSECCHKNGLILKELPATYVQNEGDFKVLTSEVSVQGTFIKLVSLLDTIEHHTTLGRVSSTSFYTYDDNKLKKKILILKIILQNIKSNKLAKV